MNAGEDIKVRAYAPGDRDTVRRISRDTAFAGLAPHGMGKEEWLADALTLYFTDFEPQLQLCRGPGGGSAGLRDGCRGRPPNAPGDAAAHRAPVDREIYHVRFSLRCLPPPLCWRRPAVLGQRRIPASGFPPRVSRGTAHQSRRRARRRGAGRKLITAFTEYARAQGVIGVQVSVLSDPARDFFKAQGFEVLYQTERTFLQKTRDEKSPWYIMGKKLTAE